MRVLLGDERGAARGFARHRNADARVGQRAGRTLTFALRGVAGRARGGGARRIGDGASRAHFGSATQGGERGAKGGGTGERLQNAENKRLCGRSDSAKSGLTLRKRCFLPAGFDSSRFG